MKQLIVKEEQIKFFSAAVCVIFFFLMIVSSQEYSQSVIFFIFPDITIQSCQLLSLCRSCLLPSTTTRRSS